MARTTRKYMTDGNYREARGGSVANGLRWDPNRAVAWSPRPWGGPSTIHGGMLMSRHNSGMWGDEYTPGDHRTKRAVKRSERQRVRAEVAADLAVEPVAAEPEPFSATEYDEYLNWRDAGLYSDEAGDYGWGWPLKDYGYPY